MRKGDMVIVRYADDIVVGFERESDACRFWDAMRDRLEEFALSLNPEKTRLIEFGRFAAYTRIGECHVAEVGRIVQSCFGDRDSMEPVSRAELLRRIKSGSVQVLDVRPEDGLVLAHLPGAVNIALEKLKRRLARLDPAKEIVAYCRGPYYVLSFEAVAPLRRNGFKVRRLEDGLPERQAAGLPAQSGA